MNGLPTGWAKATIRDIAEVQLGKMLDKSKNKGFLSAYLRNANVRWGEFDLSDVATMRFTNEEREFFSLRDGDLLVCEGGEPGRAAVWRGGETDLLFQKALQRVRPQSGIAPEWLAAVLQYMARSGDLAKNFTGTTIKHLTAVALKSLSIPVPPTNEQFRIIAQINSLFTRAKRARGELGRVASFIDRSRTQLLARCYNASRLSATQTLTLPELIAEPIRNGLSIKGSDKPPGFRALRLGALRAASIDMSDVRYLPINAQRASRYLLRVNDLLVSRGNGSLHLVGKASLVDEVPEDTVFPDTAFRIRISPHVADPQWVQMMLATPQLRSRIELQARTTAGIYKISQNDLNQLEFPTPALSQQREIFRSINSAFLHLDRVKAEVEMAIALLDRIDQAILTKAVFGELVPQNPDDEHAAILLERLRKQRNTGTKIRRVRRPASEPVAMDDAEEFLKLRIEYWPKSGYTFDELKDMISLNYEDLRNAIFNALARGDIEQSFDERLKVMKLFKVPK